MKKSEKYVYLLLGLLLGAFIAGVIVFGVMNKKDNKKVETGMNETELKISINA